MVAGDDVRYLWRQSLHNSSQNPNQRELLDSIRPENYVPPYLRKQEWKRRFHGELMSFAIRYKSMRLP